MKRREPAGEILSVAKDLAVLRAFDSPALRDRAGQAKNEEPSDGSGAPARAASWGEAITAETVLSGKAIAPELNETAAGFAQRADNMLDDESLGQHQLSRNWIE